VSEIDERVLIQQQEYTNGKATFHAANLRIWTGDGRLFVDMLECDNPPVVCVDISDAGDLRVALCNPVDCEDIEYIVGIDGKWHLQDEEQH